MAPNDPDHSRPLSGLQNDEQWEELDPKGGKTTGWAGLTKKFKKLRGTKQNSNLVWGLAGGGLLLVIMLVLGLMLGWIGGGGQQAPAVAVSSEPFAPMPPSMPAVPEYKPPAPEPESQDAEQKESDEEPPPLSDDVSTWKKEDYFRARKENDPKLLLAIVYLSEKTRGSEPAAQGLTKLLKPLPKEQLPESDTPAPDSVPPPQPGPMPPGPMPPGQPTPLGPGHMMPPGPGRMPLGPGPMPHGRRGLPSAPGPMRSNAAQPNQTELVGLVEAIIAALGENGSASAHQALEQILAGTLVTFDDKTAVETALDVLVAHPCPENDALLLKVLSAPETLRPADREGPWPAKDLQAKAFELIGDYASIALRAKLAELTPERRKTREENPIRALLFATDPLNCGAQVVFYRRGVLGMERKNNLERQLASYSGYALSRLLEIPDQEHSGGGFQRPAGGFQQPPNRFGPGGGGFGPGGGGLNLTRGRSPLPGAIGSDPTDGDTSKKPDNRQALQVADLLWSEAFCELLIPRLDELFSLEKESNLVMLAATIPQDSTRAALSTLLRKRWQDGPDTLEKLGFPDQIMTDPGLLVLVKMLPRRDHGDTVSRAAPQPARARPGTRSAEKRALAEQAWMNVSKDLVTAWRKRFQAAALAKKQEEEDWGLAAQEATPTPLPSNFTLNSPAKVIASYHAIWPEETPAGLSIENPSMLEIHYLYIEETNIPKKTVSYYARQAQTRLANARILDNSVWFDDMRVMPKTDGQRSVDVFITRPHNPIADIMRDDLEDDLVVEIMTIEIKNPR